MKLRTLPIPEATAKEMLRRAKAAMACTYPEAHTGYAATALSASGNLYDGISYKSETMTLTMHCEMTALANAAIHGDKEIVAITGPNCHMCKQFLWESALHSGIDIQILIEEGGEIRHVPISSLMQYPWPAS